MFVKIVHISNHLNYQNCKPPGERKIKAFMHRYKLLDFIKKKLNVICPKLMQLTKQTATLLRLAGYQGWRVYQGWLFYQGQKVVLLVLVLCAAGRC